MKITNKTMCACVTGLFFCISFLCGMESSLAATLIADPNATPASPKYYRNLVTNSNPAIRFDCPQVPTANGSTSAIYRGERMHGLQLPDLIRGPCHRHHVVNMLQ